MKTSLLFLCALLALSCGGDDDSSNNNNNGKTTPTTSTTQTTQKLEGSTVLVSEMSFDKEPEKNLNRLIESNLDQEALEFPIVILLDFMNVDLDAGTMTLRGGAGLKTATPGEYIWDPDGDEKTDRGEGTITKADGRFKATIELFEFIATSKFETEIIKNTIPIHELEVEGVVELDENDVPKSIKDAVIKGYITKTDGDTTFLAITPGSKGIALTKIFQDDNLNYIVSTKTVVEAGDPKADGWYLTGKISAQHTTVK